MARVTHETSVAKSYFTPSHASCRPTPSLADQLWRLSRRLTTQSANLCLCVWACVYSRRQDLVRRRLSKCRTRINWTYSSVNISHIRRTDYEYCQMSRVPWHDAPCSSVCPVVVAIRARVRVEPQRLAWHHYHDVIGSRDVISDVTNRFCLATFPYRQ